jgi:predicted ester cyclase/ribosomal protein L37E
MNALAVVTDLLRGLLQAPRHLGFARRFLDQWNAHDVDAIRASMRGGAYRDPLTQAPLRDDALARHVQALFTAFPDLRLTLSGAVMTGRNAVSARYRLDGRHTGPLPGGLGIAVVAPTGRSLSIEATLFIAFDRDGRPQVENHFDVHELAAQLGFLALLMPREQGDYQFGAYYRLHRGNAKPPEAIGITWLLVRGGQAPFDQAAQVTNAVLESFAAKPGFVTGIIGARPPDANGHSSGFTLSAWENLEAREANLLPNADHQRVVQQFMKEGLAYGTHSRVYQLVRAKPVMIACSACGKKNNAHKPVHVCSACGTALEPAPVYW